MVKETQQLLPKPTEGLQAHDMRLSALCCCTSFNHLT